MKINKQFAQQVLQADSREQLLPILQKVIELEHATIPPYLCGYFTIKQGSNISAAEIIRSVVIEEMLHLTIACNLLNALGGKPAIDTPSFIPTYPHDLPFGIGDLFEVHLRKCSVAQVRDVFMKIEEPETPIDVKTLAGLAFSMEELPEFDTIGALYTSLKHKIVELEKKASQNKPPKETTIFVGDKKRQVVPHKWFTNEEEMFPIYNMDDAVNAIDVIIDQGEGTSTDPFDQTGDAAHYYRFEQIVAGRMLVHLPGNNPPYAFGGAPVVLDDTQIWDMDDNPSISKYKAGTLSHRVATQFSYNYTKLLKSLHDTFNGNPDGIDRAMGVMYELRLTAQQALETKAEWADPSNTDDKQTGLSFEYVPINK